MIIPKTVNEFLAFLLEPESKIISFTSYRRVPQNFIVVAPQLFLLFSFIWRYMKIRAQMKNPSAALMQLSIRKYADLKIQENQDYII